MHYNYDNIKYKDGITADPYQQIIDWGYKPETKFALSVLTYDDWVNANHVLPEGAFNDGNYLFVEEDFKDDIMFLRGEYVPMETFNEIEKFRNEVFNRLLETRIGHYRDVFNKEFAKSLDPTAYIDGKKQENDFHIAQLKIATALRYYDIFVVKGTDPTQFVLPYDKDMEISRDSPFGYLETTINDFTLRNIVEVIAVAKVRNFLDSLHQDKTGISKETGNKKPETLEQSEQKVTLGKIEWLGTQKELAELFIELKKKGWIDEFSYPAIKGCFTNSKSIQQVLKPAHEKKGAKEPVYDQVYTSEYKPKFYGIREKEKK